MLKNKLIATVMVVSFLAAPTVVFAAEMTKTSHFLRKQNRAHFISKTEKKSDSVKVMDSTVSYDNIHPANIQPAAGDYEPTERNMDNSLSASMKLPRKN